MFLQHLVNALSVGSVYVLLSIGYNMVYGILEKLNFARGDVYAIGCFVVFFMIGTGCNPILAILLECLAGFILNVIVERFAYRPLRDSGRAVSTISAVGIAYIMRNLIQLTWGTETYNFNLGTLDMFSISIGGIVIRKLQTYILMIPLVLTMVILLLLKKTKWGRTIIGISQSTPAAPLMGIPANRVISIVYGLGAVLGVIGGLLFCSHYQMIYMGIGFAYGTMKAWMASIWGGIGSLKGAIVGALVLGLAEIFIGAYVSSAYKDAFAWLIFIIFILTRSQGMFPTQIAEKT